MNFDDPGASGLGIGQDEGRQNVVVLTDVGVAVANGTRPAPQTMNPTALKVLSVIHHFANGQPGNPVDLQEIIRTIGTGGPMLANESLDRLEQYGYIQRAIVGEAVV